MVEDGFVEAEQVAADFGESPFASGVPFGYEGGSAQEAASEHDA